MELITWWLKCIAGILTVSLTVILLNADGKYVHKIPAGSKGSSHHIDDGMQSDAVSQTYSDKVIIGKKIPCQPMTREVLQKIMGAAFNPRYMSIDKPKIEDLTTKDASSRQKDQAPPHNGNYKKVEAFHVHESYTRILYDEPIIFDRNNNNLNFNQHHGEPVRYETDHSDIINPGFYVSATESHISSSVQVTQHKTRHHRHHQNHHQQDEDKNDDKISKMNNKKESQDSAKHKMSSSSSSSSSTSMIDYKNAEFEQREPSTDDNSMTKAAVVTTVGEEEAAKKGKEITEDKSKFQTSAKISQKNTTSAEKFIKLVRTKRTVKGGIPWYCESKIDWIDLGANHFPRFLRTVKCTSDQCWFGHFQCRPKAFTVKILRRRKDSCTMSTEPYKSSGSSPPDGNYQKDISSDETLSQHDIDAMQDANSFVPPEFREQWVFEERAVTFCCECAS